MVVCAREGALLVVRFARSGVWTLPGGGLDHGEPPEAAAVREVAEETGYRVELGKLFGVDSAIWSRPDRGDVHALQLVYTGQVVGGELRHELSGSTDRAEWAPLVEVRERERSSADGRAGRRRAQLSRPAAITRARNSRVRGCCGSPST